MPHAKILTKQCLYTLGLLHAELAGKIANAQREVKRLRLSIFQVEAVMKMLSPEVNLRLIAPKRRNVGNPWYKRGTLHRAVVDVLRRAHEPMTADAICAVLLKGKLPEPSRLQENNLQSAILAGLRKRDGKGIEKIGHGRPQRWRLATLAEDNTGPDQRDDKAKLRR
jgi:hypothetical protein